MRQAELNATEMYLVEKAKGLRFYRPNQEGDDDLVKWIRDRFFELRARTGN